MYNIYINNIYIIYCLYINNMYICKKKSMAKKKKEYKDNVIYPKQLNLLGKTMNLLQELADEEKRQLKPQMEIILENTAKEYLERKTKNKNR